jgi:hypothetical protein
MGYDMQHDLWSRVCPWPWRVTMIEFFVTSHRLLRSIASAWRDPQFPSLLALAGITLFGGTVFYSAVEDYSAA